MFPIRNIFVFSIFVFMPAQAMAFSLDSATADCNQKSDAYACYMVGAAYEGGVQGAQKDLAKANQFYKKACDGNIHEACFNLGNNYKSGQGLPANLTIEQRNKYSTDGGSLWNKACDLGSFKACMNAGHTVIRFANGAKPAVEAFEKACNLGFGDGCVAAAEIYHKGAGMGDGVVAQNLDKANALLAKAADMGIEKEILEDIITKSNKEIFTKIALVKDAINYNVYNIQTRWVGTLDGKTMTVKHIMTGFPDSPVFRNLVQEQNTALTSDLYIAKFPSGEEYFAVAESFELSGTANEEAFEANALQAYLDLNTFLQAFSAQGK